MNYRNEFENCFSYIEENLKEKLTVTDIANSVGYSVYHFCRIFYAYQGMTPMEYVQSRRLQAALMDLAEDRKMIDIACEYGFETASGFSKAFKHKYGMTPTQMKKSIQRMMDEEIVEADRCFPLIYTVKEMEEFDICGYCIAMDYESANYADAMAAYWDKYEDNQIEERLYRELNPSKHGEIGIIIRDSLKSAKHKYLLGVMTYDSDKNTEWYNYKIAAGKYAVITTPPVDMTNSDVDFSKMVKDVWRYIFHQWLKTVDLKYDESREPFEYYDERCHYRKDSVMDIYIPIL